jgi:bacterioferritin-associated ferredoxin
MIICHCTGTTDATITNLARDGIDSVAEVTRRTGAGACCEPCRTEIAQLLKVHSGRNSAGCRAA